MYVKTDWENIGLNLLDDKIDQLVNFPKSLCAAHNKLHTLSVVEQIEQQLLRIKQMKDRMHEIRTHSYERLSLNSGLLSPIPEECSDDDCDEGFNTGGSAISASSEDAQSSTQNEQLCDTDTFIIL
ncbi:hypothetical protein ACOME3_000013 [Neoechinorhynchus agilis]